MRTHGSVEDMIKSMLGNSFVNQVQQQAEESPVMEIQQFPVNQEPSIIQPPVPKESKPASIPSKPIEKYCEDCNKPESKCVCMDSFVDQQDDDFDEQDDLDLEIEIDQEDEIPPFQKIIQSGKFRGSSSGSSSRVRNIEEEIPVRKEKVPAKPISKYYPFYRDIDEVFECNVTIEGTMSTAVVRLILNTDMWNLVFYGKIKKDGTCLIPIKKLAILPGGTTGRATLEVVVDDVVFYPWENAFRVEESRKVKVQVKGKSNK